MRIVVSHKLGGRLISAVPVGGGGSNSGMWRVRALLGGGSAGRCDTGEEREVIVKLSKARGSRVTDDLDQARVFVARSHNLQPVHALLGAHGLPTYDLLAFQFPSPEVPYFWTVMSALEGQPIGEWLDLPCGEEHASRHHFAGDALGRVHAITRRHDGWVDRTTPYLVDWGTAFFRALETNLYGRLRQAREYEERRGRAVRPGDGSLAGSEELLRAFVDGHRRRWVPAREYVLSHVDGIQAHVSRGTEDTKHGGRAGRAGQVGAVAEWVLTGHVDLEDFAFMDARLPLAGYELDCEGLERRRSVPPEFWEGYRRHREVDPSHADTRELFQLFFLIAGSRGLYSAHHPDPEQQEREIQRRTRAIVGRVTRA